MKSAAKDYLLSQASEIVDKALRDKRGLTYTEKSTVESNLERAKEIDKTERLQSAIDRGEITSIPQDPEQVAMQGELDRLRSGFTSKASSQGMPSLDFSEAHVKSMHEAAQSGFYFKASIDSTASPMSAVGDYRMSVHPFLRDRARVANLIPVERTEAPTVFYFRGSTAASAAAAVAEGAAKPESSPLWTQVAAPVRKIAHYTRINDEILQDFSNFSNVVGSELLAGLVDAENSQILTGSGTSPNLTGLLTTTGILTRARGTDSNLDAVLKAKSDLRVGASFTEPDAIVIHPSNLMTIQTQKDADGRYITNDPAAPGPETLFGMKVVATTKMTLNSALVGNFKEAATIYLRMAPTVEVAPVGGGTTEFISNQTLVRCEERLALAVQRPTSLISVTGLV
ncbi:MAG: phage major capsid protein [Actinomycetota bacterium]|nr:phage major capsid protein [Actinomycetota bacterium]